MQEEIAVHQMDSINRKKFIIDAVIRAQSRRLNTMETNTVVQATVPAVKKLFPTKAAYLAMRAAWANSTQTGHTDKIVLYNLLRGRDPKRGFTSVTNKVKLANGAAPEYAYQAARGQLKHKIQLWTKNPDLLEWFTKKPNKEVMKEYLSTFGPTVTPEILAEALKGLE
jgi:hypothetical protein